MNYESNAGLEILASNFLLIILPLSILELTAISSRAAIVCLVHSCMKQSRKSN
jgi:hypothetical protein